MIMSLDVGFSVALEQAKQPAASTERGGYSAFFL
jgi:hypothetical protein